MCFIVYNFTDKYIAKYITGNILRGMHANELKPGHKGEYRICLKPYDDDVALIWFYVSVDCVEERHELLEDLSIVTYDVYLVQNEYKLYYSYSNDDEYYQMVHRDVITESYYNEFPMRNLYTYDLMSVPIESITKYADGSSWYDVSFLSSIIMTGSSMNITVNDKSIYKIGLQDMTDLEADSDVLAPYVHIDLKNVVYDVTYKNKQTHWKIKHMDVMRDDLRRDYLVASRASYMNMSAKSYLEWLDKEKIDSSLFSGD